MSSFVFEENSNIRFKGQRYQIGNILPENEVQLHPINGGNYLIINKTELHAAFNRGQLMFLDKPWLKFAASEMPISKAPEDLNEIDETTRKEVLRKKAYVDARLKYSHLTYTKEDVKKSLNLSLNY